MDGRYGDVTDIVGWVTVVIFVIEIFLRLFAYGRVVLQQRLEHLRLHRRR